MLPQLPAVLGLGLHQTFAKVYEKVGRAQRARNFAKVGGAAPESRPPPRKGGAWRRPITPLPHRKPRKPRKPFARPSESSNPYKMAEELEVFRVVRAFDPSFADEKKLDAAAVDELRCVTPLVEHDLLDGMKRELPAYLAAAQLN